MKFANDEEWDTSLVVGWATDVSNKLEEADERQEVNEATEILFSEEIGSNILHVDLKDGLKFVQGSNKEQLLILLK